MRERREMRVALHRIFGWRPKVEETLSDIFEGRRSYSTLFPIVVSRLDTPRGGLYMVDGYHRVVEAVLRGDPAVRAVIDRFTPRIERTGGAHRSFLRDTVNIADWVRTRS